MVFEFLRRGKGGREKELTDQQKQQQELEADRKQKERLDRMMKDSGDQHRKFTEKMQKDAQKRAMDEHKRAMDAHKKVHDDFVKRNRKF
ncbi:MAG: DUF1682 domain-containing protein [Methanomicrobiales archaeon]|nr:DUF1682 domain-containing protein [Methanomicrobiales archaeon]